MTSEILSIIAVCISGVTAICSACVPAILNVKTKREELALKHKIEEEKLKREKDQANEDKFEAFYQAHLKVITDFSNYYVKWTNSLSKTAEIELITFVSKLSAQFRDKIQIALDDFVIKIKNYNSGDNLDKEYKTCLSLILNSFGVYLSDDFPDIILSDILKRALKIQFYSLQNLQTDCFGRFIFS